MSMSPRQTVSAFIVSPPPPPYFRSIELIVYSFDLLWAIR